MKITFPLAHVGCRLGMATSWAALVRWTKEHRVYFSFVQEWTLATDSTNLGAFGGGEEAKE